MTASITLRIKLVFRTLLGMRYFKSVSQIEEKNKCFWEIVLFCRLKIICIDKNGSADLDNSASIGSSAKKQTQASPISEKHYGAIDSYATKERERFTSKQTPKVNVRQNGIFFVLVKHR